jgi:hypothetical protein
MVARQNNARVKKVHETTCKWGAGQSMGYLPGMPIAAGAIMSDHWNHVLNGTTYLLRRPLQFSAIGALLVGKESTLWQIGGGF